MKGQFFLLGAIVLIVLFFVGAPLIQPPLSSPGNDLPFLLRNIKAEFPVAFNLGLNESNELNVMRNFSSFLNRTLLDRRVNFSSLWVYSRNSSTNANITIGNFLGGNLTVNLTYIDTSINIITGSTNSVNTPLFVPNAATNSTILNKPGTPFNLTIRFGSRNTTIEWLRDKANLYVHLEMGRGKDIVREEITA